VPAGQDKERGLEGVLGVGVVAQKTAADVQDHPTVAADDQGEGRLVVAGGEALEQAAVRHVPKRFLRLKAAQEALDRGRCSSRHGRRDSRWGVGSARLIQFPAAGGRQLFFE
jgi:hypothetical protein